MTAPHETNQASTRQAHDPQAHDPQAPTAQPKRPKVLRYLLLAAIAFGGLAAYGILDRSHSDAKLATWTDEQAVPSVDLVSPKPATQDQHLTLPANVEAFYTAPIHSRVNGYVRMWYHDIGTQVKTGEILARIDTPDLDQQYEQAKGELARAQADYNLAVTTADRWKALRVSQAVSQQTADEKEGDALSRKAQVSAAQANVDRVKALENFKDITSPFDGTITARRIDVGALVSATNNEKPALFDVASMKDVRVYVRVPQAYTASMHKGLKVVLRLPQYPKRDFVGALETTSNAISADSRALLVEALFKNPNELLTPGAYAEARFDLPLDPNKLVIPSSAMIFRNKSPEVAVVANGKVTLKPVAILLDTGPLIELASGLDASDKIVASPGDSIETGDIVKVSKIDGKPFGDAAAAARPQHEAKE